VAIRFDGRVAIVTGAAAGLGRAHAMALAARGAKVVINDFGGAVDGTGHSSAPAQTVADAIVAAGGEAVAHGADVANPQQVEHMVQTAMETWGRVDILINNAGILRDASFAKMTLEDFQKVMSVHVMGSVICSKAVWPHMRAANYGRILMTTSSSGLYGNFGQANYAAAKMAVIGLMNVLEIEGAKSGIHVNALAPGAATRMTEALLPEALLGLMTPESVAPAAVYLVSEDAPNRTILCATAGGYSRTYIHETEGVYLPPDQQTPEAIAAHFSAISDETGQHLYVNGAGQVTKFVSKASAERG